MSKSVALSTVAEFVGGAGDGRWCRGEETMRVREVSHSGLEGSVFGSAPSVALTSSFVAIVSLFLKGVCNLYDVIFISGWCHSDEICLVACCFVACVIVVGDANWGRGGRVASDMITTGVTAQSQSIYQSGVGSVV